MKSISKLKDEARKYEQREEWEKAIQAYLQVLRVADEGEAEVELPLYNRLGDLCVRLDKPQEAVRHYEQAADRYAEAGLYNNAIALCNKALRYNPDRLELVRKLGQFSASQGFITDARRYFLDYAERQFKGGKVTEALNALEDFANVSDDPEIREMLGRQLHAHGRINDAVDELRRAHAMRLREGDTDRAEAIRAEIRTIDPHATVGDGAAAPADTRSRGPADLPGFADVPTPAPVESEPPPLEIESFEDDGTPAVEGLEPEGVQGGELDDVEPVELAGFEGLSDLGLIDIDTDGGSGIEGLETTSLDFGEIEESPPALEDLGIEREDTSFSTGNETRDAETFDLPTLDDPGTSFDLPTLDDTGSELDVPTPDESGETFDLPTLDDPDSGIDLPSIENETESFDLPLLGDDEPASGAKEEDAPDGGAGPFELPDSAGSGSDGLGGDLPLDLSSFGKAGSSPFDLPTFDDETSDSPEWKDEPSFDLPTIDSESLGLPTWEAEPDATFDLPSFETEPVTDEPVDDEPVDGPTPDLPSLDTADGARRHDPADTADQPATEPADTSTNAGAKSKAPDIGPAPRAPIEIPAIEIPTWETGPLPEPVPEWVDESVDDTALADTEEPAYEAPTEPSEPSWVEPVPDMDEDAGPDLPTFTYEDEDADGTATVDDEDEPDTAQDTAPAARGGIDPAEDPAAEGDDPLGLAAHLAGYDPSARVRKPLPEESARDGELDSAWLDEIADDEPDVPDDIAPDEPEIDVGADLAGDIEGADDIAASDAAPPSGREEQNASVGQVPPAGDYINLGAFLTGDDVRETTRFRVQETAPTGDEDRDFAELLSQFKSKVQEHLPPEDAAAHYDLGLAFKEMGLLDEAIGEFQIALRAGHMRLRVFEELGQCFLEKEQYNIAEKVLRRALDIKFDDELELLGVYYHLGRACEALGKRDEARDAYERVLGMDINFGDVTDRLARL